MHLCLKICLTFDIERILNSEVDFYCKVHLFDRMNINLKLHFVPHAIFGIIEYPDQLNNVTPTALHSENPITITEWKLEKQTRIGMNQLVEYRTDL